MPPGRLLGMYALACMEAEGSVYGYRVSERVAERTGGAWRPGPGAVYPALQALVDRGLARSKGLGRRRVYSITARGRAVLKRVRAYQRAVPAPDVGILWAEVAGARDPGRFLVGRVSRAVDGVEAYLARSDLSPARAAALRRATLRTLDRSARRIRGPKRRVR